MTMDISVTPIGCTEDLRTTIFDLDEVTEVGIRTEPRVEGEHRFKGVVNMRTNTLVQVPSHRYVCVQNRTLQSALYDAFKSIGLEVKGTLRQYKNTYDLSVYFVDREGCAIRDDAQGVMLGVRIRNSYDKSTSLSYQLYGFRMICSNGMVLGNPLGVNISEKHKGSVASAIAQKTLHFIDAIVRGSPKVAAMVEASLGDSIAYEQAHALLLSLLTKRHAGKVEEWLLKEDGALTRWKVYNAMTAYATHTDGLSVSGQEKVQASALRVLKTPTASLLAALPLAGGDGAESEPVQDASEQDSDDETGA